MRGKGGIWNSECGMQNGELGGKAEFGIRSAECRMGNEGERRNLECAPVK
jgi:hypothetical protein